MAPVRQCRSQAACRCLGGQRHCRAAALPPRHLPHRDPLTARSACGRASGFGPQRSPGRRLPSQATKASGCVPQAASVPSARASAVVHRTPSHRASAVVHSAARDGGSRAAAAHSADSEAAAAADAETTLSRSAWHSRTRRLATLSHQGVTVAWIRRQALSARRRPSVAVTVRDAGPGRGQHDQTF